MAISKTQPMRPSLIDAVDTLNSVTPIVQETPSIDFGHSDEVTLPKEGSGARVNITFNTVKPEPPVFVCSVNSNAYAFCITESVDTKGATVYIANWEEDEDYKAIIDWIAISGR